MYTTADWVMYIRVYIFDLPNHESNMDWWRHYS